MLRYPFGERKRHMLIHRFRVEQRWLERKDPPAYGDTSEWNSAETSDERKRINHTLRISITSDAPFTRK